MNGYLDKTMLLSLLRQNAEEARIEADEFGGECVVYAECLEDVISDVERFPTIDAVPVVRCAECRYFIDLNCYASNLLRDNPRVPGIHLTGANDFCSYGERRND